jgi:hypothetical protein
LNEPFLAKGTFKDSPLMDISEILASLITRPLSSTEPSGFSVDDLKISLGGETLS